MPIEIFTIYSSGDDAQVNSLLSCWKGFYKVHFFDPHIDGFPAKMSEGHIWKERIFSCSSTFVFLSNTFLESEERKTQLPICIERAANTGNKHNVLVAKLEHCKVPPELKGFIYYDLDICYHKHLLGLFMKDTFGESGMQILQMFDKNEDKCVSMLVADIHMHQCPLIEETCPNINCNIRFLRKDRDLHITRCLFHIMPCQNQCLGCAQKFPRKDADDHTKICGYEMVHCKECREFHLRNDKDHKCRLRNWHQMVQSTTNMTRTLYRSSMNISSTDSMSTHKGVLVCNELNGDHDMSFCAVLMGNLDIRQDGETSREHETIQIPSTLFGKTTSQMKNTRRSASKNSYGREEDSNETRVFKLGRVTPYRRKVFNSLGTDLTVEQTGETGLFKQSSYW